MGKNAVMIWRSNIVGLPASLLLQRHHATVSTVHAFTKNPEHITSEADIVQRAIPHYYNCSRVYGKTFLYWFGPKPRLAIVEPEMIKEVLLNKSGSFERLEYNPLSKLLFGQGLVGLTGDTWVVHRRITSQAFNMEKVKDEENTKAISLFEDVVRMNDAIEDGAKRVENLVRGIFAGNILDLGSAQLAELFSKDGMSFFASCQNLVP
ncbi:Damage-control phosphatase [Camellia lanceoleosa]|uniref:Damage-control phosphatase n=1 Tax=Camellia lanceoleosa TaxID=1840588 RepID=A0ACC0HTL6_9ERIC|nr:Damage-control phosphatase [Camellia lanceoleosa]